MVPRVKSERGSLASVEQVGLHEHHLALAHHFDSLEEQHEASSLGMWVFLVTEVMFFGGLFMAYLAYRTAYPDAFAAGSRALDLRLGAFNTVVLLTSSLTMALAVHAAQLGTRRALAGWLFATMTLGLVFLGIKIVEYGDKFAHHLVPGPAFRWEGPLARPVELFFSLYFAMTGLHALHMVVGVLIMAWLIGTAARGRYSPAYFAPVEVGGLYWHFVDIVWIFLFPLLYLIGRHG